MSSPSVAPGHHISQVASSVNHLYSGMGLDKNGAREVVRTGQERREDETGT